MTDRFLCGWRISSEIQLPELTPWQGEDHAPDVRIRFGAVPRSIGGRKLGGGEASDASVEVTPDGIAVLEVDSVGRFLVAHGRQVTIELSQPADEPAIRLYLLGTILAMLSYQRGLLPLHASCLGFDSGAVAVAGDSGVGKSTLAATLALQGIAIMADDVCVVDTSVPHSPLAWPTVSRIKLWQDALDRLGIPAVGMEQVRKGIDKYALCKIPAFQVEPAPLIALYHLTRATVSNEEPPKVVSGISAVKLLYRSVYRPYIGNAMGLEQEMTKALMTILARVPVFSVSHNPSGAETSPLPKIILEHQRHAVARTITSPAPYLDQAMVGKLAQ